MIAEKHGGATSLENLAWACFYGKRFKGSDPASVDPTSHKVVFLFHPREQRWNRHFRLNGGRIEGITINAKLYWLAVRRCACGIPDNVQAGSRIPEEVLGPDELQRVWQEYLDSSD